MDMNILQEADNFIKVIDEIEMTNNASIRSREQLLASIEQLRAENESNKEAYDIATHAIEILKKLSDTAVIDAYRFIEASINDALGKMFRGTTRQIRIKEYIRDEKYPQLEIELTTNNGIVRSLKTDSGHGIAQIVSLLSLLCLIVLTGARRILCIDEVLSGLSIENRQIITDILWNFTEIGFQFIIVEHGYVPRGAKVYELELDGDIGKVKNSYIEETGIYVTNNNGYLTFNDIDIALNKHEDNKEESDIISI